MRNPENVLNSLREHSKISNYKFERLYRILFNDEMFYVAYQNIYARQGNMTKGTDGKTADQMSISRIESLIETLRNETYQPCPSRRVQIPKKNGKTRPLGIPSFDDKLVQEVIRMILEAIYEDSFEETSHGFRPNRSCHTALNHIRTVLTGTKWFIEGDIKGFFDNINHQILINTLKERIADERFIRLIRKFLNAGYVENWKFHKTYSGTPQGGIISPILANIYLDRFDKYMSEYCLKFNRGKERHRNKEAYKLTSKKFSLTQKLKTETNEESRKQIIAAIKDVQKQRTLIPSSDDMDTTYRRLYYVRYADDFIIGVIGSKSECVEVKEDIAEFMSKVLKLELSEEKTLITNAQKPAKFLGFDISIRKTNDTKRDMFKNPVRAFNNKIMLNINADTIRRKLLDYGAVEITTRNGKEVWNPTARTNLMNESVMDIVIRYNIEIRGLYNYYSIANNCCTLNSFYHIMKFSMLKTIAGKLQSSTRQVLRKYSVDKEFVINYVDKKGHTKQCKFYDGGFKRQRSINWSFSDKLPSKFITTGVTLKDRLKAGKCELCGERDELVMFQVRNLKSLKVDSEWGKIMTKKNRKTLAVCNNCNKKIHNGK